MQHDYSRVSDPLLSGFIQSYWQVERTLPQKGSEVMVPKGSLEIIFNLSAPASLEATIDLRPFTIPRCFISGFHTLPINMSIQDGQHFFGINLHSSGIQKLLGIQAADFVNSCLDLTLVNNTIESLWHQLGEAGTFEARIAIFSNWLAARVPDQSPRDLYLDHFLADRNNYTKTVSELSRELCYSSRQLNRKLLRLTGMNTERVLLYKKYIKSLFQIHESDESLSSIAYHASFSDQSHFIKTFKSFTGMLPGEYRSIQSLVAGHIFR